MGSERSTRRGALAEPVEIERLDVPHDDAPGDRALLDAARSLRAELEGAIAPLALREAAAGVRVTWARVAETDPREPAAWRTRLVAAAHATLGGAPGRPAWSRIAPLDPGAETWPKGWLDAVVAEAGSWELAPAGPGREPSLSGTLRLGPFAFADLLRVAATEWLAGSVRPGQRVGRDGLDVVDPGFRFPARGGDRDAAGAAVQPTVVVQGGLIVRLPPAGSAEGFLVRDSWRRPPRADWRSLALALPRAASAPDAPVVVTRVQLVGRRVLASGVVEERDGSRVRFGPLPAPPPAVWLRRADMALGPPVDDATGLPVRVPEALLIP